MRPAPLNPWQPGRRVAPVLGVLTGVLLLHAALLGLLPRTVGGPMQPAAGFALRPLIVRQLALPADRASLPSSLPSSLSSALPPSLQSPPLPSPQPSPSALSAPQRRVAPRPTAAPAVLEPEPAVVAEATPAAAGDNDTAMDPAGEAAATALPAGTPLPTYATRLPPPATLQYAVQRGGPGLQAQLIWRPDAAAASYTLSLGVGAVGSASVGALDLHGIAPERHVETRRGRETRAANFQRQPGMNGDGGGRISFSGPRIEHPLLPGVQDRLSWMLQLAGVLAAEPALGQPGRELTLLVVGVRGDAALWVFRVVAVQALPLPAGEVMNAVHLRREARHPYDTRVDVWLDPARHHLPVRLRLQHRTDGPGTEFELLQMQF